MEAGHFSDRFLASTCEPVRRIFYIRGEELVDYLFGENENLSQHQTNYLWNISDFAAKLNNYRNANAHTFNRSASVAAGERSASTSRSRSRSRMRSSTQEGHNSVQETRDRNAEREIEELLREIASVSDQQRVAEERERVDGKETPSARKSSEYGGGIKTTFAFVKKYKAEFPKLQRGEKIPRRLRHMYGNSTYEKNATDDDDDDNQKRESTTSVADKEHQKSEIGHEKEGGDQLQEKIFIQDHINVAEAEERENINIVDVASADLEREGTTTSVADQKIVPKSSILLYQETEAVLEGKESDRADGSEAIQERETDPAIANQEGENQEAEAEAVVGIEGDQEAAAEAVIGTEENEEAALVGTEEREDVKEEAAVEVEAVVEGENEEAAAEIEEENGPPSLENDTHFPLLQRHDKTTKRQRRGEF